MNSCSKPGRSSTRLAARDSSDSWKGVQRILHPGNNTIRGKQHGLPLIVVDLEREEIVKWIS